MAGRNHRETETVNLHNPWTLRWCTSSVLFCGIQHDVSTKRVSNSMIVDEEAVRSNFFYFIVEATLVSSVLL